MNRTALITGASSGIGKATAIALARENFNLILCGRRTEKLQELNDFLKDTPTHLLNFDVREKEKINEAIQSLPENFKEIDVLINNAGNAHGLDFIQDGDLNDWDAMIDINVKGLLYVSNAIIPGMVKRKRGHIINIGSTAGKEVYPKGNVYCASKHAVNALTEGMRLDLNGMGIKVGAIHPGIVETDFSNVRFKGDSHRAKKVYEGFRALQPRDIADIIAFTVTRPCHVNIADIMVMSTAQASSTIIDKSEVAI
ncbi:SDR family NAD(P)-dependent oxidoreductase [Mesonia sp. K7]|uniref:SDR family NAD(P)-dependent oxidoreductase n=1 Tax=Mesonia sp. K7 TaxID=2218606 RepID=UPI000DA7C56E|nr:SDR family NAD(P)-dependent oxidoreductase [Mesonia sp. K7]PZD79039.1 NAD(P)-dependent oxidoreductase [Mesonia sp. K7]